MDCGQGIFDNITMKCQCFNNWYSDNLNNSKCIYYSCMNCTGNNCTNITNIINTINMCNYNGHCNKPFPNNFPVNNLFGCNCYNNYEQDYYGAGYSNCSQLKNNILLYVIYTLLILLVFIIIIYLYKKYNKDKKYNNEYHNINNKKLYEHSNAVINVL